MKLPSAPPKPDFSNPLTFQMLVDTDCQGILNRGQQDYYSWDKARHIPIPDKYTPEIFWSTLKLKRIQNVQLIRIGSFLFRFSPTMFIQKELHEFDMNYGSKIGSNAPINGSDKERYLISSIMEEAIASSQIEGAITTRRVAKDMLRQNRPPRNKSERMIMNNYVTIQKIRQIINEPLTKETLLGLQKLMTSQTMDDSQYEGKFRTDDDVRVVDSTDGTIMHQPPPVAELEFLMNDVYKFFNEEQDGVFIHPVLKASILHFLIGFIHPFVDGNGRTARALFYWYMLKRGYWLTEYLSISGIILKSKVAYGKAFLNTESDELDLTYFLTYKARVMQHAYENLRKYLQRKIDEKRAASLFMRQGGINERQAQILQWITEDPSKIISVKEVEATFSVANETARKDLKALCDLKLLDVKNVNKQKQVFIKASNFDNIISTFK